MYEMAANSSTANFYQQPQAPLVAPSPAQWGISLHNKMAVHAYYKCSVHRETTKKKSQLYTKTKFC